MKKSILFLMCLFSQSILAQDIIRSNPSGTEYIVSNLIDSQAHGYRWAGGHKNRRAASFYTSDSYYGATYRVRQVVLHYDKWNPIYENKWADRRWGKPRIFADQPDGKSPAGIDEDRGALVIFGTQENRNFSSNQDLVGMGPKQHRVLQSHRTYWMIFDTGYGGEEKMPDHDWKLYHKFFKAKDTREYSPVGWTIGNNEMFSSDEGENYRWANPHNTPPLQFALRVDRRLPDAFEIGDTLSPGNLAEANVDSPILFERYRNIDNDRWVATRFWTVSTGGSPPHKFRLDHVTMLNSVRSYRALTQGSGEHVIAIYDNNRSTNPDTPGEEIARFSSDLPEVIDGEFPGSLLVDLDQQHRFHADPNQPILLEPWTAYWLVQKVENWVSGTRAIALGIPCFTESKYQEGWIIGDYYFRTHNRGQNWIEVDETHGAHNDRTMRFGFGATIVNPWSGDINVDGDVNIFDLILINDHIGYSHPLSRSVFYLGNLNSDSGSSVINDSDRDLLLDIILRR